MSVKRVDHYYNASEKAWCHKDTDSDIPAEAVQPIGGVVTANNDWDNYDFVVVRKLPDPRRPYDNPNVTFKVVVKSPYLLQACKEVIGDIPRLSWKSKPVELDPTLLVAFYPQLAAHETALREKADRPEDEEKTLTAFSALLSWLRQNYEHTLARLQELVANGEISYDLLYGILIPGTIFVTRDVATGEMRAARLLAFQRTAEYYNLTCEGLEAADARKDESINGRGSGKDNNGEDDDETDDDYEMDDGDSGYEGGERQGSPQRATQHAFGMHARTLSVREFAGTVKINKLPVFPLAFHPNPAQLRAELVKRGRKWASLNGVYHVYYNGLAGKITCNGGYARYNVNSRIMIDRGNFARLEANYSIPKPGEPFAQKPANKDSVWKLNKEQDVSGLTDDHLLLATPVLYGFSLADKIWLEYSVQLVHAISWNAETFAGLVLPTDRKTLLRSLVEAHDADGGAGFDDFVRGKGQGLVINLFGPPGVGKTLSAEATSEHIRRPLYVVGSGDLGTSPSQLDSALERIFDIATAWRAIVLIDEADVFLEQRSLHDLDRNAMVAVFLRHVEYYRGILFLTTNRIMTFDEAFLSRIHVALHFGDLAEETRARIWRAFLKKGGLTFEVVSAERVAALAARNVNGRQIKNACRTATSLARSRGQPLQYEHLVEALDAMEAFVAEFTAMKGQ
ncbi:P-loop containing nucleoside triphosphate hydrolase protein [Epithele typhae]|uniref:P-loop containing nucleoside triphosphate hydrolase protein n=1 Tax=Epithele typhae TaxID=378194 RepID=UPI002008746A|nr:P-loop containing nucleoside triphosphate hydrolase protein [Epithele typhae]KAH9938893.1 P-loop containing nucleoside triphosphate hydrolase protein [Epithele typhae]